MPFASKTRCSLGSNSKVLGGQQRIIELIERIRHAQVAAIEVLRVHRVCHINLHALRPGYLGRKSGQGFAPASIIRQEEGVTSKITYEPVTKLARTVHEQRQRLPDVLFCDFVWDFVLAVRSVLWLHLNKDEARLRWQPIECGEMIEVATVDIDRQEIEAAMRQPLSFQNTSEAVIARINESAFSNYIAVTGVVCR